MTTRIGSPPTSERKDATTTLLTSIPVFLAIGTAVLLGGIQLFRKGFRHAD